ncbi:GATA transcription factor 9 [Porphyridium purpureum]|uniref:GATA transcription factor 9 n=1 Tax=Porphyridium purpureum TaxID=35688 RepID=A0A5J4Z763_PORPP|nr:GATA transcription factor 9 [Porphyridium purpureum]|eukprot:POR0852..scf295_1
MVASSAGKRCAHCSASDTPLWRVGPSGPKTLCNACGLRWRKTGRLDDVDDGAVHAGRNSHQGIPGARKPVASSKHTVKGVKKSSSAAAKGSAAAAVAAKRRSDAEGSYSPSSYVSDEDDADVRLLDVQPYGRGRVPRNMSPAHYWPPAVEEFRRSAVLKSERSYTVDDFWPLYRNVFSGLMVVQKTHR